MVKGFSPAPDILTLTISNHTYPVEQQPLDDTQYISEDPEHFTQYGQAAFYGAPWLMAHDDLAGSILPTLAEGDQVAIQTKDRTLTYTIAEIRTTANKPGVFEELTVLPGRLILQTCAGDELLFLIGEEKR